MADRNPGTDFRLCTKLQPNPFSNFGGYPSRTDRQTDSKVNIHHYHEEIITNKLQNQCHVVQTLMALFAMATPRRLTFGT